MAPVSRGPIPESGPADPRCYVMAIDPTSPENLTPTEGSRWPDARCVRRGQSGV